MSETNISPRPVEVTCDGCGQWTQCCQWQNTHYWLCLMCALKWNSER